MLVVLTKLMLWPNNDLEPIDVEWFMHFQLFLSSS